jgi:lipase chaperone LimK
MPRKPIQRDHLLDDLSRQHLFEALEEKDPADRILYQFAVRQLMLLAALAGDETIRLASARFLAEQSAPRLQAPPARHGWGEQEQLAISKIDAILVRRGLSKPQAMEFEAVQEGHPEEIAREADNESEQ